jgi:hypothetical protein
MCPVRFFLVEIFGLILQYGLYTNLIPYLLFNIPQCFQQMLKKIFHAKNAKLFIDIWVNQTKKSTIF